MVRAVCSTEGVGGGDKERMAAFADDSSGDVKTRVL